MAKMTNLNVKVAETTCRNCSLTPLVKAWGLKPEIAVANGYDKSRSVGPRGETPRLRARGHAQPRRAVKLPLLAANPRRLMLMHVVDRIDAAR